MPIRINGTPQDQKLLKKTLAEIKKLIQATDKMPDAKKTKMIAVLDDPAWSIAADLPFGGKLNGATYKRSKRIRVSLNTFAGGINRFRAVIFHELVHASCEGEFDAEVFECIMFPPSKNLPGGGTWPFGDDLDPFENETGPGPDGFRATDHFVWDPATGRVWRRKPDGSRGPIVWDDPDIWDKWKTTRRMAMTSARDTSEETFIDYSEPDDYGYVALDVDIVRPPLDEELLALDQEELDVSDGLSINFSEFVDADNNLPISLAPRFVAKVAPDSTAPEAITTIRMSDGGEVRVKGNFSDVVSQFR